MTTVHHTHTTTHAAAHSGRVLFDAILGFPRRFRERRQLNALLGYDDFLLRDIGISRDSIQRGAGRSLWRD